MKTLDSLLTSTLCAFVLVCLFSSPGWGGADHKRVEYELRKRSAEVGCPETQVEIAQARKAHPESVELARLEGECDIHRFDYENASQALTDAARLDPKAENVQLYLAISLYHLEEFDPAWTAIEAAKVRKHPDMPSFNGAFAQQSLHNQANQLPRNRQPAS